LPRILATPPDVLSPRIVRVISDLAEDWRRLDDRIDHLSTEIAVMSTGDRTILGKISKRGNRYLRVCSR
jgi:transposase